MKWLVPVALLVICLLVAGCTESESSPDGAVTEGSVPTSTSSTIPPSTTSTPAIPTLTFGEEEDPPEFTDFTNSTACDPEAEDANLQVIQAFVTAYNERDRTRLAELVPAETIDDMSGIPHLGKDHWTHVGTWADMGWKASDEFRLVRLVMYDSGSVFDLERSNDVLRAKGIESLLHQGKVHSSRCRISRLVLYLSRSDDPSSPVCLFWEVFADTLAEGTTQPISRPAACLG